MACFSHWISQECNMYAVYKSFSHRLNLRTSSELLYRGPPGEPNVWTAFFVQPAEIKIASEASSCEMVLGEGMP